MSLIHEKIMLMESSIDFERWPLLFTCNKLKNKNDKKEKKLTLIDWIKNGVNLNNI